MKTSCTLVAIGLILAGITVMSNRTRADQVVITTDTLVAAGDGFFAMGDFAFNPPIANGVLEGIWDVFRWYFCLASSSLVKSCDEDVWPVGGQWILTT